MIELSSRAKLPKIKRTHSTPEPVRNAIKAYIDAYKGLYAAVPQATYNRTTHFIDLATGGVSLKRLKELTRQLKDRKGDM